MVKKNDYSNSDDFVTLYEYVSHDDYIIDYNAYTSTTNVYGTAPTDPQDNQVDSYYDDFEEEEEEEPCDDPCFCWGDCDEPVTNSTPETPAEDETPTDKPKATDCEEADAIPAQKSENKLKEFLYLPTISQLDNINQQQLQTIDGNQEFPLLPRPTLRQNNSVMTMLNFYASNKFVEAGYTFEYRTYGSFISNLITGNSTTINLPMTSNTSAIIHSHPMQINGQPTAGPSPQDFVGLLEARIQDGCSKLTDSYVVAHGGAIYALSITDSEAAQAFYSQNKANLGTENGMFKEGGQFFKEYQAMNEYLKKLGFSTTDSHDAAMAYVLDNNKTGVKLMKKEKGDNEFKTMNTKGTMNSDEKVTSASSTKCK